MSKILAMETGVTVITPDASRPGDPSVCYLLHGSYGNHESWATYTMLPVYAQQYNTVFVMPEAGRSFYADTAAGQRYFTYVAEELPKIVEKTFRISAGRENTAIMGGSMGGFGALTIALRRPDRFGRCCALGSAALFLRRFMEGLPGGDDGARFQALSGIVGRQLAEDFRGVLGEALSVPPELDAPALAEVLAAASVKPVFYSACGVDDAAFRGENAEFAGLLRSLGFEYMYEELPGGHDWAFFDGALKRALEVR
jgi:S-formylglutathione hydrolase FrmB